MRGARLIQGGAMDLCRTRTGQLGFAGCDWCKRMLQLTSWMSCFEVIDGRKTGKPAVAQRHASMPNKLGAGTTSATRWLAPVVDPRHAGRLH